MFNIPQATAESGTSSAISYESILVEYLKKSWLLNNRKAFARVVECTIRALSEDKADTLSKVAGIYLPQVTTTVSSVLQEQAGGILNYCIDENSFKKHFLPVVGRKLLRSPETAIPVFEVILKELELTIGEIGAEIIDPLISNLIATDPSIREASVSSLVSIAKLCSVQSVTIVIYNRVLSKLNGPDGRRASLEVKLTLLHALGSLSQPKSGNAKAFPEVQRSFIDMITSEDNEDMIESSLKQLGLWLKLPKFSLNEKAQTTIKEKLFANKTSHRVKMAIFRFLDETRRSSGKLPKAYIPLLATAAQAAKQEVPASPLVSQAVAAASLWLMNTSQPGKIPENMWSVLSGLKVTPEDQDSIPLWLKDRFLLTTSPDVHSYLISCIHILLTHHANEFSHTQRGAFYRILILLWLYTDSRQVLEDIHFCLLIHLVKEGKRNRVVGQSIIQNHLNLLVLESLNRASDLLAAGVENAPRFGRRLVQLVTMVGKAASATTLKLVESIFTNSRLTPALGDSLIQEALSEGQKLGLFCATLYPLSHPLAVDYNRNAWIDLLSIIRLPRKAEAMAAFNEAEGIEAFNNVVDRLFELPKLDVAHRLMLQRLIEWSPVKFASHLATRLCSELSNSKYTNVTADEVGIMLAQPGTLYNRALLDSLPRYQINRSSIKREGKLYSHETQMDILEAQAKQKERRLAAGGKEPDFLASVAPQLTPKQLGIIKAEMEKEEDIRKRISKLFTEGSHLMDLLTILNDTLLNENEDSQSASFEFLLRNSFNLWSLTVHLLQLPLLSPLAIAAHSRLGRLMAEVAMVPAVTDARIRRQKAQHFAAWSIRVLKPPRICLRNQPPVPSFQVASFVEEESICAENGKWHAICRLFTLREQSEVVTECLRKDVIKRTASGAIIISAAIPIFDQILVKHSTFAHFEELKSTGNEEKEEKRWALCAHYGGFLATVWNQVRPTAGFYDNIGSYSKLCEALQFGVIYKFLLHLIEQHSLALELGLIVEGNSRDDDGLSAFSNDVFQNTVKLHIHYLLYLLQYQPEKRETILISMTPIVYDLMERLVAPTHFTRSSALTGMINLAKHFPDLFTHSLSPPILTTIVAVPIAHGNNAEDQQEKQQSEDIASVVAITGAKSSDGNLNRVQKKKRKRAATAVVSNKAMGEGDLRMDESVADPTSWPTLCLIANSQLRLFISRCDPFVEVAIDADRLWTAVGLRDGCESEKMVVNAEPVDDDQQDQQQEQQQEGKIGDEEEEKRPKQHHLFVLLQRPRNPDVLSPPVLATRLLLECLRKSADIQKASACALQRCLNGKSQDEINRVIDYWLEVYRCLMEKSQPKVDAHGKPIEPLPPKYTKQRVGLAHALEAIVTCSRTPGYYLASQQEAPIVIDVNIKQQKAGIWLQKIFRFLVDEGLHDSQEEVRCALLQAGLGATRNYGVTNLQQLLPVLEAFLNKAPNIEELDMVRQSVVVLLGSLAKYLGQEDTRVGVIFNRLLSAVSFPADVVQKAVEDAMTPLAPKLPIEQLEKVFPRLMTTLFSSLGYAERRGAAYALAGIVRGCGIATLRQRGIIDRLLAALEDKNPKFKESALFAFERLSLVLGRLFEPYVVKLVPQLLSCFGDPNLGVREAASVTSRAVMSKISAHGIKLILPLLLKVIDEDNSWRTKCRTSACTPSCVCLHGELTYPSVPVEAVEVLGTMTSCAPKQLSSCLPQIMPRILTVLIDAQVNLKKAGACALERIGTVIRNPEVQALVPCLIKSLQDPLTDKGTCLLTLRDTCFTHVVDAASLALIMPVLHRAFDDRSTSIRKAAAQIFGTLYRLARREDLEPYIVQILPGLRHCLLDPVPEVRSVTARALGAMVRGIGEACSKDLLPWLMTTLTSEQSSVDRSGAAQGLAEVLGGMGLPRLESILPEFIRTAESTNVQPYVRDGYLMLFIYLPEVFRNEFSPFIAPILSPILKGLADECEYLRETALRAGQRIIDLFANEAVELLLPELEKGLLSVEWRIRLSSLHLTGDLLYKLSGVSGKGTTRTADEDDTFGTNAASEKILETLGEERRNRVLARLHIARSDPTYTVRNAASHIWKIVVVNTPRTLRELMPVLVQLLLTSLGSTLREHQQVAGRALGDLVKKLGERVLPEVIPHLEEGLNSPDENRRRGVCNGLIDIMNNCQPEQIAYFSDRLTSPIRRSLVDPSAEVRATGARAFDLLYSGIHLRAIDEILPELFVLLDDPQRREFALDGIRQLLAIRGRALMPYLVPKLTHPRLDAKTFAHLAPIAGDSLARHLDRILPAFLEAAVGVDACAKESADLRYCSIVLASISDTTAVRSILQELITGLSLSDSNATQIEFTSLKPNTPEYCYACLRLLHVYLEAFLVDNAGEEEREPHMISVRRKVTNVITEESDNDDSDGENTSRGRSGDDDDDFMAKNNAGDDDGSDSSDDHDMFPRPRDPKESLRCLLPDYYSPLLRNLSKLLAVKDLPLMTFAWACLEAILKYWSTNSISGDNVIELQKAIKTATVDFVSNQLRLQRERAQDVVAGRLMLLPGFSEPTLPLPSLVRFYADCILQGSMDAKEPAAQGLAECVALSSGEAIQPCVVKVLGPMIRLLGERQPPVVRAAVTESLATLVEKCPTSTRPFSPQLLVTFSKVLGDPTKEIRLVGGLGLANVLAISPKLDFILVDICTILATTFDVTIANPPSSRPLGLHQQILAAAATYADTMLQCLRNCLQKSSGKPKLTTLRTVIDYLTPLGYLADGAGAGKIDPTVNLADVRRAANACIGASVASASVITDVTASDVIGLMPWCQSSANILETPLVLQSYAQAIMVVSLSSPKTLVQSTFEEVYDQCRFTIAKCCTSDQIEVRQAGHRSLGFFLHASIVASKPDDQISNLVKIIAQGLKLNPPEDRMLVAKIVCCIASRINLRSLLKGTGKSRTDPPPAWLLNLVNALCIASKDKNANVCTAAEEGIVSLCQIGGSSCEKNDITALITKSLNPKEKVLFEETLARVHKRAIGPIWNRETRWIDNTEIYLPSHTSSF
ncbi:Translational activator GCN1 [Echinococcus granulosus]|uniref:Translational activator GCN1 n=1 Tax=Echinococcus granulosus TaxID=6210 RepID=W6UPD1_ECHGR|nr:Translational activator GCN1 [Echinococcus granulosus]EUB63098.1 Translational activator GCN1 [Echinococcus granulosus]